MNEPKRGAALAKIWRAARAFGPVFVNDARAVNSGPPLPYAGRGDNRRTKNGRWSNKKKKSIPPKSPPAPGKVRQSCSTDAPEKVTPPFDGGVVV